MAKSEKRIKDKWLGARVDDAMDIKVSAYLTGSDDPDLTMGSLVRMATLEYMANHPVKSASSKVNVNDVPKPGVPA